MPISILNKRESLIVSLLSLPDDEIKELAASVPRIDKTGRCEIVKTIFEDLRFLGEDSLAEVARYVRNIRMKRQRERLGAIHGVLSEEDGQIFEEVLRSTRRT